MTRFNTQRVDPYIPKNFLRAKTHLTDQDIIELQIDTSDEGVNLFSAITQLTAYYHQVKSVIPRNGSLDLAEIERSTRQEALLTHRIRNQTLLMELAPKEVMQSRMVDALTGYKNMVTTFIKEVANTFNGETRENIEKMTRIFNKVVEKIVAEEGQILEYELDGSATLLETRLLKKSSIDDVESIVEAMKKSQVLSNSEDEDLALGEDFYDL